MTTIRKLLIGFTAGAIIGILYAPQKGSKTRRKLSEAGDNIREGWNNLADKLTDSIDGVRAGVENIADQSFSSLEESDFQVDNPDVTTMKGTY
jgi:gas vesicle protein